MSPRLAKDPYDGRLDSWDDVVDEAAWDVLVLGNGMSINLWRGFSYESLFVEATSCGLLSEADRGLFEKLELENFEEVLRMLSDAIVVGEAIGEDRSTEQELYESIQKALAEAVQAVHIEGGDIPVESLEAIRAELRNYRHVFTASYDLLVYWASAQGPNEHRPFDGFYDFFWANGTNAFDRSTIRIAPKDPNTRLYFLHGALHAVVLGDGTTCKRTTRAVGLSLLNQFGEPFIGDETARPLIVTEAAAEDKLRSITSNDYLSYCWDTLAGCDCPVVVFGHSLSEQDWHLVEALNAHPERAIAVALLDAGTRQNLRAQHRVASLLDARPLYFFDSETHPLGDSALTVSSVSAPF